MFRSNLLILLVLGCGVTTSPSVSADNAAKRGLEGGTSVLTPTHIPQGIEVISEEKKLLAEMKKMQLSELIDAPTPILQLAASIDKESFMDVVGWLTGKRIGEAKEQVSQITNKKDANGCAWFDYLPDDNWYDVLESVLLLVDISLTNAEGDTLIHVCSKKGYHKTLGQVKLNGMSQGLKLNRSGLSALGMAFKYNSDECADVLLDNDDYKSQETQEMFECAASSSDYVSKIRNAGIKEDGLMVNIAISAIANNNLPVLEGVLDDVDKNNDNSFKLFAKAINTKCLCELLKDRGFKLDAKDESDDLAIYAAANDQVEFLIFLENNSIELKSARPSDTTPLVAAILNNAEQAVEFLLSNKRSNLLFTKKYSDRSWTSWDLLMLSMHSSLSIFKKVISALADESAICFADNYNWSEADTLSLMASESASDKFAYLVDKLQKASKILPTICSGQHIDTAMRIAIDLDLDDLAYDLATHQHSEQHLVHTGISSTDGSLNYMRKYSLNVIGQDGLTPVLRAAALRKWDLLEKLFQVSAEDQNKQIRKACIVSLHESGHGSYTIGIAPALAICNQWDLMTMLFDLIDSYGSETVNTYVAKKASTDHWTAPLRGVSAKDSSNLGSKVKDIYESVLDDEINRLIDKNIGLALPHLLVKFRKPDLFKRVLKLGIDIDAETSNAAGELTISEFIETELACEQDIRSTFVSIVTAERKDRKN